MSADVFVNFKIAGIFRAMREKRLGAGQGSQPSLRVTPKAHRSTRLFARWPVRWLGLVFGVTLLTVFAAFFWLLWTARVAEREKASTAAANLSIALAHDIARNIELYDLSIQNVIEGITKPDVMATPPELRRLILFDHAATAQFLGSILVLDEHGNVIIDSRSLAPRSYNYADRDYFQVQAERPDRGLYVSRPLRGKTDGQWVVGFSRRYDKGDGSFGGVVVGTLRLDYIHGMFERLKLGPENALALYRTDGTLMMREPYDPGKIGQVQNLPKDFGREAAETEGEFETRATLDGVTRLYHFSKLAGFPLVQFVGLSTRTIYADWWRRAELSCAILATCAGTIVALGLFLIRELRRRTAAEAALLAMAEQDGLTGLANRRRLDRTLETEWKRAARTGSPLSVLMIDADQFKSYNDTYGHLAGDKLLVSIARSITGRILRPGDLAARYGGEEFMVLLPNTDVAGAQTVAETIRVAIAKLEEPHRIAFWRVATVSIGVASMRPTLNGEAATLVAAADAALYQAKDAGRNAIRVASGVPDANLTASFAA